MPIRLTPEQAMKCRLGQMSANKQILKEIAPGRFATRELHAETDEMREQMTKMRRLQMRPTTDESSLNKTESSYLQWLRGQGDLWIGVQCITLKIGHDCRLTMDFWALDDHGLRAIDTKACRKTGKPQIEEDAMIKIRIAARMFPWIHFVIAWKDGEVWQHREIKP